MPLEFVSAQFFQHRIKTPSLSPVAQREREREKIGELKDAIHKRMRKTCQT
jgi:hypothetical protein